MANRIVCLGEVLLRLSAPGNELLLQRPQLEVQVGGAEANVAAALAAFGHAPALVSVLPDNALGHAARKALRGLGIDTAPVRFSDGRMGLYFYTCGAGHRPSDVLYDRAGSAFANAQPAAFDWPALLQEARLLHLSGITPALGANTSQLALEAARAARANGTLVSFDGNFRAKLWAAWNGDPRSTLHALFAEADIAFADHRDIGLVLGTRFDDIDEPAARFARAAAAAFDAFPNLQRIACTTRVASRVDHHHLGAQMTHRDGTLLQRAPIELGGIVDRIGGGDAFAAGVLHGVLQGMDDADALAFGQAAGVLKHYLPGDAFTLGVDEVMALVNGERLDVRR